jgi:shikimate kinase
MGAGKTTVGQALAHRLGWPFVDLDRRIEAVSGRSIPQWFAGPGERAFRKIERAMLMDGLTTLSKRNACVIALGGGAFAQPGVAQKAAQAGVLSIFLDAGADELWARCLDQSNNRPLALDENQFRQLYAARRKHYMKADICVCTSGKSVREIVDTLCVRLGGKTPGGET